MILSLRQWWGYCIHAPTAVLVLLFGNFFCRTSLFLVWPYVTLVLSKKFSLSPVEIGTYLAVTVIANLLAGPVMGYLADRFSRKWVIITGFAGFALAFFIFYFATQVEMLLLSMVIFGVAKSMAEDQSKALIGDLAQAGQVRDFYYQLRYFLINAGCVAGSLIGLTFSMTGNKSLFLIAALVYMVATVIFCYVFRQLPQPHSLQKTVDLGLKKSIYCMLQDQRLLLFVLAAVLLEYVYTHLEGPISLYWISQGHFEVSKMIAYTVFVNGITVISLQFPLLLLLEKWPIYLRIYLGLFIFSAGQLIFWLAPADVLATWVIGIFVFSLGEVVLAPNLALQLDRIAPAYLRGSYFGVMTLQSAGAIASPILGGWMLQVGFDRHIFGVTTLVCGIILILYIRLKQVISRQVQL